MACFLTIKKTKVANSDFVHDIMCTSSAQLTFDHISSMAKTYNTASSEQIHTKSTLYPVVSWVILMHDSIVCALKKLFISTKWNSNDQENEAMLEEASNAVSFPEYLSGTYIPRIIGWSFEWVETHQ